MTSNPGDSFNKSLERFRAKLSDEQKREFSLSSLGDVELAIQEIQDRLGPEKRLRNFTKIRKFLEGMKQVEELVKIFLNVHEVVAFIWGPIKLALMVATTRIDTLENLLSVYEEIGEVIHGLRQYDRLFRNYPDVRGVLEIYFYDVLQFHQCVLDVFARPGWKKFFNYAWPTFKTRFRPIVDSLKRHRALLSDEKLTAVIEEVQESRSVTENKLGELSKDIKENLHGLKETVEKKNLEFQDSLLQRKSVIASKLDSPDYEADQQSASAQRHSPSSGDWVLQEPSFASWVNADALPNGVLYLSGIPGSGKTILISRIIHHMRSRRPALKGAIAFFYFKHRDSSKRSMSAMLRALMVQLLYQEDTLLEYLHQKCASMSQPELMSLPLLQELAKDCLMSQRIVWVILDGLDEYGERQDTDHREPQRIIEWFQNSIVPVCPLQKGRIQLLIAGQRDGYIDRFLSKYSSIRLDAVNFHIRDIEEYSKSRAAQIRRRFSLGSADEADIIEKVTKASKGMFLYARVVLDNFYSQDSAAELEKELAKDNFPEGLDAAYERVAIRILDRPPRARQKSAASILGWIVCSARPLRWREIQSRFCIDLDQGSCNIKNRRVDHCKIVCGSLVEVEPCEHHGDLPSEQVINLVHDTAGKYLVHTGRVSLFEEHARMAIFCSRYLTSYPFKDGLEAINIRDFALSGYYSLQDYAAAFWHYHVESIVTDASGLATDLRTDVVKSAMHLLVNYPPTPPKESVAENSASTLVQAEQNIRKLIEEWHNNRSHTVATLERRTTAIRKVIESVGPTSPDDPADAAFLELAGVPRFKCPKIHCWKFATGFLKQHTRDSHVNEHERPFKCPAENCYARVSGFSSQSTLDAHIKRFHLDDTGPPTIFPTNKGGKERTIFTACSQGNLEEVRAFHCNGINLDAPSQARGGLTPLVLAARHGHAQICKYLLEHGADVYSFKYPRISPLAETIKRRDVELLRFLYYNARRTQKPPEADIFSKYVAQALKSGSSEILEEILAGKSTSDIRQIMAEVLHELCFGRRWVVDSSMSALDTTLLHIFFRRGFPMLYEPEKPALRPNFHLESQNPASDDWHSELVNQSWPLGGDTPLHLAFMFGIYCFAAFLLDLLRPEDLRITNKKGATPLHTLASRARLQDNNRHCRANLAQRLVQADNGVAANIKDTNGNLPVLLACSLDNKEVFKVLVDHTKTWTRKTT